MSVPVKLSFVNPRPRKRRTRPSCGPSRFEFLVLDYSFGFEPCYPSCSTCHQPPFAFSSNSWALTLLLRAFCFPLVLHALPVTGQSWVVTAVSPGALSRQSKQPCVNRNVMMFHSQSPNSTASQPGNDHQLEFLD